MMGREVNLQVIERWQPKESIRVGEEVVAVLGACGLHGAAHRRIELGRGQVGGRKCMLRV